MVLENFELGQGERTTVLLHGFLGQGRNLRSLAQAWSEADPRRRFLVPDLTGHGTSPALPPGADLQTLARDVLETVRAKGSAGGSSGPVDFVGHSLGGRVSLAASLLAPQEVASIALLDIAPGPIASRLSESGNVLDVLLLAPTVAENRRAMRAELTGHGLSEPLADWLVMNLTPTPEGGVTWRFDRHALELLHRKTNSVDLWPAVERPGAGIPIRCIRGGRSHYVTDADKARMEAAGCPVATLPEARHYVHTEEPQALLRWLLEG